MEPKYQLLGNIHSVTPLSRNGNVTLEVDGHPIDVRIEWSDGGVGKLMLNGRPMSVYVAQDGPWIYVHLDGRVFVLESLDDFSQAGEVRGLTDGLVKAPMPGMVVESFVSEGQAVGESDTLLLIESMKMQIELKPSVAGVVKAIKVATGDSFEKGQVLIEVDPEPLNARGDC